MKLKNGDICFIGLGNFCGKELYLTDGKLRYIINNPIAEGNVSDADVYILRKLNSYDVTTKHLVIEGEFFFKRTTSPYSKLKESSCYILNKKLSFKRNIDDEEALIRFLEETLNNQKNITSTPSKIKITDFLIRQVPNVILAIIILAAYFIFFT